MIKRRIKTLLILIVLSFIVLLALAACVSPTGTPACPTPDPTPGSPAACSIPGQPTGAPAANPFSGGLGPSAPTPTHQP